MLNDQYKSRVADIETLFRSILLLMRHGMIA